MKPALTAEGWTRHLNGTARIKRSGEMEIGLGVYAGISTDEDRERAANDSLSYGTVPPFLILHWHTVNDREALHDPHKLAALCLHNQPYGFTHEDVKLCRLAATGFLSHHEWGEPSASDRDAARELRSLASRIAALLPPEKP